MNESEQTRENNFDAKIDASDLYCPLPVLRAKKALDQMSENSVLKLIATDPGSENDIQAFVDQAGYLLLETEHDENTYVFYIKKTIN